MVAETVDTATTRKAKTMTDQITLIFNPNARDFTNALHNASLFMGDDYTLPAIAGVRFEYEPNGENAGLTLVATDRYQLSTQTVEPSDTGDNPRAFAFTLPAAEVKLLLTAHKTAKLFLELTFDGDKLRVVSGATTEHTVSTEKFIAWRALIPAEGAGEPTDAISFNPKMLVKLAKVKTSTTLQTVDLIPNGPHKGATVRFVDGPTVITMPVRKP